MPVNYFGYSASDGICFRHFWERRDQAKAQKCSNLFKMQLLEPFPKNIVNTLFPMYSELHEYLLLLECSFSNLTKECLIIKNNDSAGRIYAPWLFYFEESYFHF